MLIRPARCPDQSDHSGKWVVERREEWQADNVVIVTMREEQIEIGIGRSLHCLAGRPQTRACIEKEPVRAALHFDACSVAAIPLELGA